MNHALVHGPSKRFGYRWSSKLSESPRFRDIEITQALFHITQALNYLI